MVFFNMIASLKIEVTTIPLLVWAVYFGVAVGILLTYYNKSVLGKAIRALIEKEAIGKEHALTAEELGFSRNKLVINSIRRGALARFVHSVKEGDVTRYYLNKDERIRAELRYSNKGTDLFVVIISLIIFLLVAFVFARYLPIWIAAAGEIAA